MNCFFDGATAGNNVQNEEVDMNYIKWFDYFMQRACCLL